MKSPLVSCIVPVFNGQRYLGEALDSILAQTYRAFEIIVADDGSTDGTSAVAGRYGRSVRYLRQPNAGPAAARNLGLSAARGEFVAFVDQDDLWHPEKLARQMARFETRPELDLCIAHVQMFWVPELQGEAARLRNQPRVHVVPGYTTGTLLARRTFFEAVGDFDTSLWFGDATEWFLRVADRKAVIELLPDILLYHRMHRANLTRRLSAASRNEFLAIVKQSLDHRRRSGGGPAFLELPKSSAPWNEMK
jgi:glycosyltransferase involved in cell wall biosynthesis